MRFQSQYLKSKASILEKIMTLSRTVRNKCDVAFSFGALTQYSYLKRLTRLVKETMITVFSDPKIAVPSTYISVRNCSLKVLLWSMVVIYIKKIENRTLSQSQMEAG